MILLHLQTFPFLSSFLKKHRKAGRSFPGTTDHGNAQVGAMQPKAERPRMHGGTSPLKDKFIRYLRGKTTNPSLLTDLSRQKLRHNSLGSMTPPHPPTLPWGLCDMSCWGTQIGCPELCLRDFWGLDDELRGFLPFNAETPQQYEKRWDSLAQPQRNRINRHPWSQAGLTFPSGTESTLPIVHENLGDYRTCLHFF